METPQPLEDNGDPLPNGWKRPCGAKTRDGSSCRRPPLAGRTRCRLHGGATPAGAASPHFKHGRRSRYLRGLPGEFQSAYKATQKDPDLLSLREDLALLEAHICQLLSRLSRKPAPQGQVLKALDRLKRAGDGADAEAALEALDQLIRSGRDLLRTDDALWREILAVIQVKVRVAPVEWKRLKDLRALVPVEEALTFVKALLAVARETVTDPETYRRLMQRCLALVSPDDRRGLAAE
jgi:hypothetical protein